MGKGMRNILSGYYRPSDSEFSELWKKGIVILDTNILLNLYCYPKEPRDELMNILKKLSNDNRLWIPYQVALEYQDRRLNVISEQVRAYSEVKDTLNSVLKIIREKFDKLQLREKHSSINSINPYEFLETTKNAFYKFIKELKSLEKKQLKANDHDELRYDIDKLLDGKIGLPPYSQDDLDRIYAEGERRYKNKIPPGYENDGESEFTNNGLFYKRKYGDLILWKQIIDEAIKREDFKYIIFITDDEKNEWWSTEIGKSSVPRPELVSEVVSKANVSLFYMYRQEIFLRKSGEYLGMEISEESINQIRDINRMAMIKFPARDILGLADTGVLKLISFAKFLASNEEESKKFLSYITEEQVKQEKAMKTLGEMGLTANLKTVKDDEE